MAELRSGLRRDRHRAGPQARRTRARRFTRQHAEGDPGESPESFGRVRCRSLRTLARRVRVPPPVGTARTPNLEAEAAFQAAGAKSRTKALSWPHFSPVPDLALQVLDLCAGAGGKTLALAAGMQNTGQIYAYDDDRNRLKPIFEPRQTRGRPQRPDPERRRSESSGSAGPEVRSRARRRPLHRHRRVAPTA